MRFNEWRVYKDCRQLNRSDSCTYFVAKFSLVMLFSVIFVCGWREWSSSCFALHWPRPPQHLLFTPWPCPCPLLIMQVLQIVKELVSPSRRRASSRFAGVYVKLYRSLYLYLFGVTKSLSWFWKVFFSAFALVYVKMLCIVLYVWVDGRGVKDKVKTHLFIKAALFF